MTTTLGVVLLGLAAVWMCGGLALRVGGMAVALLGLLDLVAVGSAGGLVLVVAGLALWKVGRLHRAVRNGYAPSTFRMRAGLAGRGGLPSGRRRSRNDSGR